MHFLWISISPETSRRSVRQYNAVILARPFVQRREGSVVAVCRTHPHKICFFSYLKMDIYFYCRYFWACVHCHIPRVLCMRYMKMLHLSFTWLYFISVHDHCAVFPNSPCSTNRWETPAPWNEDFRKRRHLVQKASKPRQIVFLAMCLPINPFLGPSSSCASHWMFSHREACPCRVCLTKL